MGQFKEIHIPASPKQLSFQSLHSPTIPHSPQRDDHADGQEDGGDDATDSEEDHFIFDVIDDTGLAGDMQVADQGLQAFFVHEVSEISQGGGQDKYQEHGGADDDDFDPFGPGDEGDREEEDVSCEGDEDDDQDGVFYEKGKAFGVEPDGIQHHDGDDGGDDPPEQFGDKFLFEDG